MATVWRIGPWNAASAVIAAPLSLELRHADAAVLAVQYPGTLWCRDRAGTALDGASGHRTREPFVSFLWLVGKGTSFVERS
jgi:hypothetical protein